MDLSRNAKRGIVSIVWKLSAVLAGLGAVLLGVLWALGLVGTGTLGTIGGPLVLYTIVAAFVADVIAPGNDLIWGPSPDPEGDSE